MKLRQLSHEDIEWLDLNRHADINALWLKYRGDEDMEFLITQLQCRQKAGGKLSDGEIVDEYFVYPNTLAVEQCSGSSMARLHALMIAPDDRVLDMTMGLGIDAMTIARRCREIVMLDLKQENVDAACLNIERLSLKNAHALCNDSIKYLSESPDGAFDVIFIDPARRGANGKRLYALSDCEPDVTELVKLTHTKTRRLIVKASPMLDIEKVVNEFSSYHVDITITGSLTECKELIADIRFDMPPMADYNISCVVPEVGRMDFTLSEERESTATYVNPEVGMSLFEPAPPLLKSGCFNLLSCRYGLWKIAPATHLYISQSPLTDVKLGSWWKILEVRDFDKRSIKEISQQYPSLSIASRNFPMDAEALRKKLKVTENRGQLKLWATTDSSGKKCLIIGERI